MKLEQLQKQWEEDSKIDQTNLGAEATRNPQLHSKYLTYLSNTKLLRRKAETDYLDLRKAKFVYYRGEMSKPQLEERGWTQYLGRTLNKSELDEVLRLDSALRRLEDKVEYYATMQSFLEGVVKCLGGRTWDIRAAVDWYKAQNGLM